jgi:EAL domain-containing protein (putative c-di-GMP-specific phosphodiesterase class I)/GGDEF domain-containing protein
MSLIKQVWLLLVATLALAFVGSFVVSTQSARQYLRTQLSFKNNDTAQALALMLSQQRGDLTALELTVASQFDTGYYERIRLLAADGRALVDRRSADIKMSAPRWFAALAPIDAAPGVAQVSDGWKALGSVEVVSQRRFGYDELWWGTLRSAGWLALLGMAAGLLAAWGVRRIQGPLEATVGQAEAITGRRFVTVDEPGVPELRRVTRAMNTMVERLRGTFNEQAQEAARLRREANCDPLTGVAHRAYFMSRLTGWLTREDSNPSGTLVLVRVADLASVNRHLGRVQTDDFLRELSRELASLLAPADDGEVGRLNGSDFALALANPGSPASIAEEVGVRMRQLVESRPRGTVTVLIAAVGWQHGSMPGPVMTAADGALARAEAAAERGGPVAIEVADQAVVDSGFGEFAWHESIRAAVDGTRAELAGFPVVRADGELVHLECPLRLQLLPGEEAVPAVRWLPMARRTRQTGLVDVMAVRLALEAISRDRRPRGVNVAPVSLLDSGFVGELRALLAQHGAAARLLSIEVAEPAAVHHFGLLRELGTQLRPLGVKLGLEHAGEHVAEIDRLMEVGLDYVKLDASGTRGLAQDATRANYVGSTVRMLHSLGLQVYAEGVVNADDAARLWQCRVDGITGPVVKRG